MRLLFTVVLPDIFAIEIVDAFSAKCTRCTFSLMSENSELFEMSLPPSFTWISPEIRMFPQISSTWLFYRLHKFGKKQLITVEEEGSWTLDNNIVFASVIIISE